MSTRLAGSDASSDPRPKVTVAAFRDKRRRGEPIAVLTAYDYPTAHALDAAGVDAILVGDSLAMVVLGHPDTLSVTMNEMLHHARAVSRGATTPLLIGDMPFMSYQADVAEAVRNAGRFLQEAGMNAVKLEGGRSVAPAVKAIVQAGIPVQGHLGLTPQSLNQLGGWRVQGRTAEAARALLEDALTLEDSGCFSIVLESVPARLAAYITERLEVPTIGIGAGPGTSGQVLVTHDLLGLYDRFTPRFAKRYADLGQAMATAFAAFRADVVAGLFPGPEHAYNLPTEEWEAFLASLGEELPVTAASR
ncbi:MAG TPA: 3-methyl-2-oxobutanoate hydroxymethyltransferase [Vicinamibacteria bacterium]|jgi:3-methyl-2-oxobutanoate hydroxymethyltransferase|nr:3-methyl-2-oxobutanoate hydroxymethyltransferase [Vicinamibacteria bacterium]